MGVAAVYRLYLYDINLTASNSETIKGIRFEDGVIDGTADVVLNAGGKSEIKEASANKMLFALPNTALYLFFKSFKLKFYIDIQLLY